MHDAVHDSLTGLPNRELFIDRLSVAVTRGLAEPAFRPTILFLDLDKFKSINSSFGLIVGDSLLLTVARRLQRTLNPADTLARIGGDQFAILIAGAARPARTRHARRATAPFAALADQDRRPGDRPHRLNRNRRRRRVAR